MTRMDTDSQTCACRAGLGRRHDAAREAETPAALDRMPLVFRFRGSVSRATRGGQARRAA
jgi:hypothetical protein